jgi:crotonobetainyl-CoA:carnitine CoA-transferase CaiB-like acyl-CoA transferase
VAKLADILKKLGSKDILAKLEAAEVPCAPVMEIHEVIADPQVQARGMLSQIEYPGAGSFKVGNLPFKASGMGQPPGTRAPMLGEHTQEILEGLGYDSAGIDAFEQNGVIFRG